MTADILKFTSKANEEKDKKLEDLVDAAFEDMQNLRMTCGNDKDMLTSILIIQFLMSLVILPKASKYNTVDDMMEFYHQCIEHIEDDLPALFELILKLEKEAAND